MNRVKNSVLFILGYLFFLSCTKNKGYTEPVTEPPSKKIIYRISEYGTDQPLEMVNLLWRVCTVSDFGWCTNTRIIGRWVSNSEGLIIIRKGDISNRRLSVGSQSEWSFVKDGYIFPIIGNRVVFPEYDSVQVTMYPMGYIELRVINSINLETGVYLNVQMTPIPSPLGFSTESLNIQPLKSIDTTVYRVTLGSIKHSIEAKIDSFGLSRSVFYEEHFIEKGDTLKIEINIK